MALANAVTGGLRPSQTITWTRDDGTAENLTGATITGVIIDDAGDSRAIAGDLTISDAESGIFVWAYDADDVETAGRYLVQFTATFGSQPSPAKTRREPWLVME